MEKKIVIDNCEFEIRKNVKMLTSNIHTSELSFIYYNNEKIDSTINYYLLFETCLDSAFAHWIYESAIYLPYFYQLKQIYSGLKLLVKLNPMRKYKSLFFNAFNINENDIYWLNNEEPAICNDIAYNDIPYNNYCINTKPHYLNTVIVKNKKLFSNLIMNFKNTIIKNLDIIYTQNKNIDNLFFPRSKIENYASNDRTIDYSIVYKLLEEKQYIIYDTINTVNIKNQINLLVLSNNIFLDWGSSLLVNGLFCNNSNIYVSCCILGQLKYEGIKIIFEILSISNTIIYI